MSGRQQEGAVESFQLILIIIINNNNTFRTSSHLHLQAHDRLSLGEAAFATFLPRSIQQFSGVCVCALYDHYRSSDHLTERRCVLLLLACNCVAAT